MNRALACATALLMALAGVSTVSCVKLSISVRYDDGSGSPKSLYVRGSACGLSWDSGAPLQADGAGSFSISLSCDDQVSELQYKVLVEDQVWQVGANEVAKLSDSPPTHVSFPWFYATNGTLHILPDVRFPCFA